MVLSFADIWYQAGLLRQAATVVRPEKQRGRDASLHGIQDAGLHRVDVAGEVLQERFFVELRKPARRDKTIACRWSRELHGQRGVVLSGIGCTCGPRKTSAATLGSMPASLMIVPANEWPTSTVGPSCSARIRCVAATSSASEVSEVLHRRGTQPSGLQASDHIAPARPVGVRAVHQHDIANARRRGLRADDGETSDAAAPAASAVEKCRRLIMGQAPVN